VCGLKKRDKPEKKTLRIGSRAHTRTRRALSSFEFSRSRSRECCRRVTPLVATNARTHQRAEERNRSVLMESMATDVNEISSNSFFSQPFMVEIIKLAAGVIFWETQFVLSKFFLNVLPENSEKEKIFKRTAPSYCVSTVHATFLTWGGVKIICALYNAPHNEQVILYESTDGSFVAFCEFISVAFLSYMIQDFLHVVHLFPELGGIDMVFHHILFFVAGFSAYVYGGYPLMLGYLTICEGSTPFLNMRWFIKSIKEMEYTLPIVDYIAQKVGMKYRGLPAGNRLEYHISTVFSYVFIFVRVIMFGHGILLLLPRFGKGEDKIIPSFVRGILLVLIFCGFLLNLVWVVKMRGMLKYYRSKWFDKPEDNQQNRID
jgi:hypothetical protein